MNAHSKLPLRITLLLGLVLIITAWNLIRLVTSFGWHDTLETYAPQPGSFYIGLTGAIWTLIGLFSFWSFVRGTSWIRMALLITVFVYAVWVWVDKLFVQQQLRANWPFDLLTTIILLGFTTTVLLDPHHLIYFLKRDL